MYYQSSNEAELELQPSFFTAMLESQQKYKKSKDQESMKQLLCYYTDCVNYFQLKQEPISQYFQLKIKKLAKQIKQYSPDKIGEKNKQKMTKNIIRVMQQENIQQKITTAMKKQKKIDQAVNKILQQQNERLQRRRNTKRAFSKSQSVMTMSFGSEDSLSPQPKRTNVKMNSKFLFTKQINSDQQKSTT